LLDHAEFGASPLFDGVIALFQVEHLGVEHCVACRELRVGLALRFDLGIEFVHAQPSALAEPQRILDQGDQQYQREPEENAFDQPRFNW
jgi:hypothetical protein